MMYQNVDSIFNGIVLNNKIPHPSIIKKKIRKNNEKKKTL